VWSFYLRGGLFVFTTTKNSKNHYQRLGWIFHGYGYTEEVCSWLIKSNDVSTSIIRRNGALILALSSL
jgi:hypothetical protein